MQMALPNIINMVDEIIVTNTINECNYRSIKTDYELKYIITNKDIVNCSFLLLQFNTTSLGKIT